MGAKIMGILFFVVFLGGVLFVFRSGIISKLSFPTRPFSLPGATSSWPTYPSHPENSTGAPSQNKWTIGGSQSAPNYGAASAISPQDVPQGFAIDQLSPQFHKVRIGSVSPGSESFYGQISLSASFSGSDSIDVTGWTIKSNKDSQFVPRAVNIYDPSGLTQEGEITLKSGDVLNMYSGQSAIGENLRLNKCLGFLENYNHFIPALPMNCPYVDRSEVSGFTGACQDLVLSLGSCRLPPPNPLLASTDYACRSFLANINYRGCFEKHVSDADFLSHEWRAWIGGRFFDPRHDDLLLFDKQGLLVDKYSY